jgi:hypothetical protein
VTDTDARLVERLRGNPFVVKNALDAADRIGSLTAELEHFIDIVDGTETTGFDPHVEQMLMDAAESARAVLRGQQVRAA